MSINEKEVKVFARYWRRFVYLGFILIFIGFIGSILFGISFGTILIPLGIGVTSLGLGFLSVTMASESSRIAKESKDISQDSIDISQDAKIIAEGTDIKVNSIGNANFLRIIGQIEDLRLEFKDSDFVGNEETGQLELQPRLKRKREIYGWKCFTYIREANEILEFCDIDVLYIQRFLNLFNHYLVQIKIVREFDNLEYSFSLEEIHHLFMMFERMLDFGRYLSEDKLTEIDYITKIDKSRIHLQDILLLNEGLFIDIDLIKDYDEILSYIRKENTSIRYYEFNDIIETQYFDSIE